MATPGGYSNPGTSTGAGTGSGYPSTGYSGPQSLGSSNSSFVMISPVASGSGGAAPVRSLNGHMRGVASLVSLLKAVSTVAFCKRSFLFLSTFESNYLVGIED